MDVLALISDHTTSVALAIVIMWFYNKLVIDFLAERKEMIEAIRAERKEWLATSDRYYVQVHDVLQRAIVAIETTKAEIHALRGKLTEFLLKGGAKKDE